MQLCFATNNHHKLEEVMGVLGEAFQLLTLRDIGCVGDLPETQNTIAGNAHQKAKYVWDRYKIPCFADDTGLEVEALNGAPGIYSARYAGDQRSASANIQLLLNNMKPIENRKAQFRTVISLIMPGGEWDFEGIMHGMILNKPRGEGGFGYDPVFLPDGYAQSLAEMSLAEKNQCSHRAIALNKLAEFLR